MKALHLITFFLIILLTIAQSPDQLYDELFQAVQLQRIFSDSKTFCDAIPRRLGPNEILDLYRQEFNNSTFNLTSFIFENFILPNTTAVVHEAWTIDQHCHRLWPLFHIHLLYLVDVLENFIIGILTLRC